MKWDLQTAGCGSSTLAPPRIASSVDPLGIEPVAPLHDRRNQSGHVQRPAQPAHRHMQRMIITIVGKARDQLVAREYGAAGCQGDEERQRIRPKGDAAVVNRDLTATQLDDHSVSGEQIDAALYQLLGNQANQRPEAVTVGDYWANPCLA